MHLTAMMVSTMLLIALGSSTSGTSAAEDEIIGNDHPIAAELQPALQRLFDAVRKAELDSIVLLALPEYREGALRALRDEKSKAFGDLLADSRSLRSALRSRVALEVLFLRHRRLQSIGDGTTVCLVESAALPGLRSDLRRLLRQADPAVKWCRFFFRTDSRWFMSFEYEEEGDIG